MRQINSPNTTKCSQMLPNVPKCFQKHPNAHKCSQMLSNDPSPPRLGGGMFVNFSVLNNVCQFCQRIAKYALSIDNLYQKYTTRGYACEILGPHKVDKQTFLGKQFFRIFPTHQFWPPRTSPDSF